MPSLEETKRSGYSRHRQASAGAAITLVCGCGEYVATFECAKRIAGVLGNRDLEDLGDGLLETIPRYRIRFVEMAAALTKLSETFSVALVDMDDNGRFVLIWRVNPVQQGDIVMPISEVTLDDL